MSVSHLRLPGSVLRTKDPKHFQNQTHPTPQNKRIPELIPNEGIFAAIVRK